jgi:cytochrome c553
LTSKIQFTFLLALALGGTLIAGGAKKADTNKKGALLYETCKTCHGDKGEGNTLIEAPSILGLPEWYLISTLTKFKEGIRGAHPDDKRGLNMRPMARALKGKEEIEAVAKYVANMKPVPAKHTLKGDPVKGKALYATCFACHGMKGEGTKPPIAAPPIANLPDWYVVNQLEKFKSGVRGTHPKDTTGASMRGMAIALPNKQAMIDVAAYIATLKATTQEKAEPAKH